MKKKSLYQINNTVAPAPTGWGTRLRNLQLQMAKANGAGARYIVANCDAVYRTVNGEGPDDAGASAHAGARITFNMSSVHIPGFCAATRRGEANAFKNCYDLAAALHARGIAKQINERRELVDKSLPLPPGGKVETTYFGAVDINGSGVRFYGDVCLVLAREQSAACVILDRNSYDLVRSPVKELVAQAGRGSRDKEAAQRRAIALSWSGSWNGDLGHIVAAKALAVIPMGNRRWTTGHISFAVCSDEDYIEVLKQGSFNAHDIQEARLTSADVAEDALTAARLATRRPAPRLESMLWAHRRARAEAALRAMGVPVRVAGYHGRNKN